MFARVSRAEVSARLSLPAGKRWSSRKLAGSGRYIGRAGATFISFNGARTFRRQTRIGRHRREIGVRTSCSRQDGYCNNVVSDDATPFPELLGPQCPRWVSFPRTCVQLAETEELGNQWRVSHFWNQHGRIKQLMTGRKPRCKRKAFPRQPVDMLAIQDCDVL